MLNLWERHKAEWGNGWVVICHGVVVDVDGEPWVSVVVVVVVDTSPRRKAVEQVIVAPS